MLHVMQMSWMVNGGHKSQISGSHVVRRLTSMDQSRVELVTKQWDTIADLSHPRAPQPPATVPSYFKIPKCSKK